MNNQTIGDIYETNGKIHEQTKKIAAELSDEQSANLPDGEKWTIAHIFEHIAIVQEGMTKISAKLLNEAKSAGKESDGTARISENFRSKTAQIREMKLEAPERVQPTGNRSIAESLAKMDENQKRMDELKPLFESVDCSDFKFPHPFMGGLTAHEWLALIGGHEARHLKQIEERLKVRTEN